MNYNAVISMSTQTTNIFKEMRSDEKFDKIWDIVIEMAKENNIESAQLPRKKNANETWRRWTSTPRNTD